jgi:hypothetical protein
LVEEYLRGAKGRFERLPSDIGSTKGAKAETYQVPNPLALPGDDSEALSPEGGKTRAPKPARVINGAHEPSERVSKPTEDKFRSRKIAPVAQLQLLEEPTRYKAKRK